MPEDQRRGREADAEARGSHTEASSDSAEAKRAYVIHAVAAGVTQRAREVVQSLRGLTHRVSG